MRATSPVSWVEVPASFRTATRRTSDEALENGDINAYDEFDLLWIPDNDELDWTEVHIGSPTYSPYNGSILEKMTGICADCRMYERASLRGCSATEAELAIRFADEIEKKIRN